MGINATNAPGGAPRTPALEAGTYPARLIQVIDLGLQPQRAWEGKDKPPAQMILTTYEFVDEFLRDEDGNDMLDKPRWLSERFVLYNLESERAKSTIRYNAFDPKHEHEGDWSKLLDNAVSVTIVKNPGKGRNVGRELNYIAGVAPMRAKDEKTCPALINTPVCFDLDAPDLAVYMSLVKWVKDLITSNLEFGGSRLEKMLKDAKESEPEKKDSSLDDEIPF